MNTKRFAISTLAVFVALFAMDFVIHGMLLSEAYEQTANLWRPHEEYKMEFMAISQLLFAGMFVYIFTLNFEDKGLGEGLRYGLLIGLIFSAIELGKYSYMPVPITLVLSWIVTGTVQCVIMGAIAAKTYKK